MRDEERETAPTCEACDASCLSSTMVQEATRSFCCDDCRSDWHSEHDQAIIVIGNIAEGFRFLGPFPNQLKATQYADQAVKDPSATWIAALERP